MQEYRYKPRPCDRCGAGHLDEDDFDSGYDDQPSPNDFKETPMCSEFHMAYGMVTWLCYCCRRDWHKKLDSHSLTDQYAEAQLRLDFWKARINEKTPKDDVEEGIKFLRDCTRIEDEINALANHWLATS